MRALSIIAVAAAACGGPSGNQVTGTVKDVGVATVAASIVAVDFDGKSIWVTLSDAASTCDAAKAAGVVKDSHAVFVQLTEWTAGAGGGDPELIAPTPGEYGIPAPFTPTPGRWATVYLGNFAGTQCADTLGDDGVATGGSVNLAAAVPGSASGTFSAAFPTGTLTGSFEAKTACEKAPAFSGCFGE